MIKKPPTHEQLVAALGAQHDSEIICQLLEDFGLQWSDVKLVDKDTHEHSYSSKDEGFRLSFEDIGEVFEKENHDIGDGPFLLTKISFWGYIKDNRRYQHLPFSGLTFDSTVEEVQKILGVSFQTNLGSSEPFKWQFENYKISMHWFEGPRKNRAVGGVLDFV
jgi:hypothetical protein